MGDSFTLGDTELFWDGHASVRAEHDGFTVAVDPFSDAGTDFTAQLVLLTHQDAGHFDPAAIKEVSDSRTVVVAPASMEDSDIPGRDLEFLEEGEEIDVYGVRVKSVPMYNSSHERGEGLGYLFEMDGGTVYVAGDTGEFNEARELEGEVDVAFLPVEGVYTMDVAEAVRLAAKMRPGTVVPYHYGDPFFPDQDPDLNGLGAELEDRSIGCRILEPQESTSP